MKITEIRSALPLSNTAPSDNPKSKKQPNCGQFRRIQSLMEADPALRRHLGPKECHIQNRLGQQYAFSSETIKVVTAICNRGEDPIKVPKNRVLKEAGLLLIYNGKANDKGKSDAGFGAPYGQPEPHPVRMVKVDTTHSLDRHEVGDTGQMTITPVGHDQSSLMGTSSSSRVEKTHETSDVVSTTTSLDPKGEPPKAEPVVAETPSAPVIGVQKDGVKRQVIRLNLSQIVVDPGIQCRAAVNKRIVKQYSERMKAGDEFPEIVVFEVKGAFLLSDGFHRSAAVKMAGLTSLPVDIRQGSRSDAIKFAIEANSSHGLPRTNKDKRRAVELALTEFRNVSDHLIAEMCKVSQPFVGKVRNELITVISSVKRTGRDGKQRKRPSPTADAVKLDRRNPEERHQPGRSEANAKRKQQSKTPVEDIERADFDLSVEWQSIYEFLCANVAKWPSRHYAQLTKSLHEFANSLC